MGGKSSTSTNSVTIPQDVLSRYNSVNATAQQAAQTPFQTYNGEFVAPLSPTQQAGIANTNSAAGQAQPYFQAATNQLGQAQGAATPYYGAATQTQSDALNTGSQYAGASLGALAGGNQAAQPYQQAAGQSYGGAYAGAQPYNQAAAGLAGGAYAGAQPYNQVAAGLAGASAQAVNPDSLNTQQYLSPYLSTVLQGTEGILNQQNQQAQSGQLGNAITSGAFGGDRSGVAAANLNQQQNLANAQIYSNILNQGYSQALGAAQQQQGLYYDAAAANRSALAGAGQQFQSIGNQAYSQGANTASQLANIGNQTYTQGMGLGTSLQGLGGQLYGQGATNASQLAALGQQQYGQGAGTSAAYANLGQGIYNMGSSTSQQLAALGQGAQGASLQGAQAQLAAGQTQQQTQQAQDTALYNQFLQQQSYPFQTAQFLANIAEGTGSLSGSTTTSTQPGGFFSDRRLKENIKHIGKTNDGQTIYSYNYKGDPRTQIGLMAQEVEKKHPEAVGLAGGYKTVDYAKATADAARHKRYAGGLVPANDDHVEHMRMAAGGMSSGFDPQLAQAMLSAQQNVYGGAHGPASPEAGMYGGLGRVPVGQSGGHTLAVAAAQPQQKSNGLGSAKDTASLLHDAWGAGEKVNDWLKPGAPSTSASLDLDKLAGGSPDAPPPVDGGLSGAGDIYGGNYARGGLIDARHRFGNGGMPYDQSGGPAGLDIPEEAPTAKLATANGGSNAPSSGQQDFNDAMKIAQTAAMFMALKRGGRAERAAGGLAGRHGYALDGTVDDGTDVYGDPDDPTDQRRYIAQPGSGNAFAPDTFSKGMGHTAAGGLGALANAATFVANPVGGLANMAMDEATRQRPAATASAPVATPGNLLPGDADDHYVGSSNPLTRPGVGHNSRGLHPGRPAAAPPAADVKPYGTSAEADSEGSDMDFAPGAWDELERARQINRAAPGNLQANADNPQIGTGDPSIGVPSKTGLAAAAPPADHTQGQPGGGGFFSGLLHGASGALDKYGQPVAHLADGVTDVAGNALTGLGRGALKYSQSLKNGDEQAWVPLLTGLSAMGTAPTRSLGVALATGVGAGAQAYPALQTQQAKLQSQRLLNSEQAAKIAKSGLAGGPAAPGQPGINMGGENVGLTSTVPAVKQAFQPTIAQPAPPPAPGAPLEYRNSPVGLAGKKFSSDAMGNYFLADDAAKANAPQDYARISNEYRAANDGRVNLDALENSVTGAIHQKGGTGPYTPLASGWMAVANQIATAFGLPRPDPAMAANPQLMLKYATDLAAARAQAGDQRSAEALGTLAKTVPSPDMTPEANAQLMAALKIQNQTAIDRGVYRNRIEAMGATPGRYLPSDLEQSFRQDVTNEQQAKDKDALAGLYMSEVGKDAKGNGISKFQMLRQQIQAAPSKEARDDMLRKIDTRYGPGFHRYLTGGQW